MSEDQDFTVLHRVVALGDLELGVEAACSEVPSGRLSQPPPDYRTPAWDVVWVAFLSSGSVPRAPVGEACGGCPQRGR